jgi:hypothetical protein
MVEIALYVDVIILECRMPVNGISVVVKNLQSHICFIGQVIYAFISCLTV